MTAPRRQLPRPASARSATGPTCSRQSARPAAPRSPERLQRRRHPPPAPVPPCLCCRQDPVGTSAACSAIAVTGSAPAGTAAARCRIPRRRRGSAPPPDTSGDPGNHAGQSSDQHVRAGEIWHPSKTTGSRPAVIFGRIHAPTGAPLSSRAQRAVAAASLRAAPPSPDRLRIRERPQPYPRTRA